MGFELRDRVRRERIRNHPRLLPLHTSAPRTASTLARLIRKRAGYWRSDTGVLIRAGGAFALYRWKAGVGFVFRRMQTTTSRAEYTITKR